MLHRTIGSTRRKPKIIVPGAFLFVLYVFSSHICNQLIAGSSVLWTGRSIPFTLRPDDGFVYVDQYHDSARLSQYPLMLPLCAAADAMHSREMAPLVDWPTVDVIADRNGLRKLMLWVNPSPGREVLHFRIDVQLVGTKTLLLCRGEPPQVRSARPAHLGMPLRSQ